MTSKKIIPARNWGQRVIAALLIAVVALLVFMVGTSRHINWSAVPQYILDDTILDGIRLTILFTILSMVISVVAGAILATMRLASNPVLSGFASLYIWFFRGTPLLVQIIFWFNIQLFIPSIDIGSIHIDTNSIVTAFVAALLALSLNEAAYMAEIIRGGLLAVDNGQQEAAKALGYTPVHPADRQPDDLDAEDDLARLRRGGSRSADACAEYLRPELPDHRAADCRQHLVPRDDHRCVRHPTRH